MSMRLQLQGIALADTGTGGLIGMLGAGAASVYPRLDDPQQVPPAPVVNRPWVLMQILPFTRTNTGMSVGGFRFRIMDTRGARYYSIDAISTRLKELYPWKRGALYQDPGGNVFAQQFAFESEDTVDDNWDVLTRWVEWQLFRATK